MIGSLIGACIVTVACGVAPVKHEASPPKRHLFASAHGVPLAYNGGVCTRESLHTHSYPPVPSASFLLCEKGALDKRPLYAFFGGHQEPGGSCFIEQFHLHVEPPAQGHRWNDEQAAYVWGEPAGHACDRSPCAHRPGASGCSPPAPK